MPVQMLNRFVEVVPPVYECIKSLGNYVVYYMSQLEITRSGTIHYYVCLGSTRTLDSFLIESIEFVRFALILHTVT